MTRDADRSSPAQPTYMTRVCPLLERETATTVLDIAPAPWVVRECRETGFVFLENPPGYESLRADIAWEVSWAREAERRAAAEPVLHALGEVAKRVRSPGRNKVADLSTAIVQGLNAPRIDLLDVGCGEGTLLGVVMDRLPEAVRRRCVPQGIEISDELARRSQAALGAHGGRCVHATALEGMAVFPADSVDLIVLASFLEHEIQPLPLLRECARVLRTGGRVVVKVPNHASWNRHVRGRRWCGYRWPDHVNYFTPRTLAAAARRAGLDVARMNGLDRLPVSDSLYAVLATGAPHRGA
jgi:SAM-dependent methyltransferase